jgi:hypothetical protein
MTIGKLTTNVDTWTVQAVVASGWLTRLYRSLGDDRQAALAIQVGKPGMERLSRLGLESRLPAQLEGFLRQHPDETRAEEAAWTLLVEAYGGISAFIAVTDSTDGRAAPGLRGTRTATNGAFRKAIQGFHTAFPEEIVGPAVTTATRKAYAQCADAFLADVDEEDPGKLSELRASLEVCVAETIVTLFAGAR